MALLLLFLVATAVYSNTFSASFHFDDQTNITENPWVKHLSKNLLDFSSSRYVGFLTFALNYHFGRLNVFGYHLVNLLIHILNGFLVYTLVRLLFRAGNTPPQTPDALRLPAGQAGLTPAPWVALATALLFIAHPIQTQAVTYIVQRIASLAALFYLLTVVCYLQWRLTPPETKRRHLWYVGALAATILAMKTKENTFTLPFMLLLVEAVFFAPLIRKTWLRLLPFFLTLPIIPLSRSGTLGGGEAGLVRETMDISRWDYLITQLHVIVTYLRLLIFPVNQNLDYDYPVYHSLFTPPVFLSFLFLAALFALAIYLLLPSRLTPHATRFTPYALRLTAFGILWFFLTLSIESSIIPIRDVIYEHRLYLPSVGIFLTAAVAALGLSDRWMNQRIIAVGLVIFVLAGVAYQRNKVWQDELTLWSDVVKKSPQKARTHSTLGKAYAERKEWDQAIRQYNIALKIDSHDARIHYNLANTYKALGRFDEAVQEYQSALQLLPDYAEAHNNLGLVYETLGRPDDALREYQAALTAMPYLAETHNNLGVLYREQGRLKEALREYQVALRLDPDFAEVHNNIGIMLKSVGRPELAIREYHIAIHLRPDYAEAHTNLGNVLIDLDRHDEALREFRQAMTLNPTDSRNYIQLGQVYSARGKLSDAATVLEQATRLDPNNLQAHNNLGNVYKNLGRPEEAIREYQKALSLDPNYTFALNNLGVVYYVQGRYTDALRTFQKSIQVKPDDAQVHHFTGIIYNKLGRMKEAIQEYEIAVKLKPDLADAQFNLGQAYQQMGRTREAIQAYEQALKIKPDYEKARQALNSLTR